MAVTPEQHRPIDSDGSARLLDWLLLPLLSFCGCGINDEHHVDVIDQDTVARSAPFDAQPAGRSPTAIEAGEEGDKMDTAIEQVTSIDEVTRRPKSDTKYYDLTASCGDYSAISQPVDDDVIESSDGSARPSDLPLLRSQGLPLLPLLLICGHLRTDEACKDLRNFRQTCRRFAAATNTFFERAANLPAIDSIDCVLNGFNLALSGSLPSVNYVMHPVSGDQAAFRGVTGRRCYGPRTQFDGTVCLLDDAAIERAAQSLLGPVGRLCFTLDYDVPAIRNAARILRNISVRSIRFTLRALTLDIGALVLSLATQQQPAVELVFDIAFVSPAFLDSLYASTSSVSLRQPAHNPYPLLGASTAFWQRWLKEKLLDGCTITVDREPFTEISADLTRNPRWVEWKKEE